MGALSSASSAQARTVIDTTPFWSGPSQGNICGLARPFYASVGQVVTVPASDTVLDSFTFYLFEFGPIPGATLTFRGEVYAWDGNEATGPNLWEGPPRSLRLDATWQEVTFVTGGIGLVAGQRYILFATLSKDYESNAEGARSCLGAVGQDVYGGGSWAFSDDRGDESAWTRTRWLTDADFGAGELAFKASFSAALPSTKDQCKSAGWRRYGVFSNQGDCVSFVATRGRNPPARPPPG